MPKGQLVYTETGCKPTKEKMLWAERNRRLLQLKRRKEREDAVGKLRLFEYNIQSSLVKLLTKVTNPNKRSLNYYFLSPFDYVAHKVYNYPEIVKKPMDFETLKRNVETGVYRELHEFVADARLIFHNCLKFNRMNGNDFDIKIRKAALKLCNLFEKYLADLTLSLVERIERRTCDEEIERFEKRLKARLRREKEQKEKIERECREKENALLLREQNPKAMLQPSRVKQDGYILKTTLSRHSIEKQQKVLQRRKQKEAELKLIRDTDDAIALAEERVDQRKKADSAPRKRDKSLVFNFNLRRLSKTGLSALKGEPEAPPVVFTVNSSVKRRLKRKRTVNTNPLFCGHGDVIATAADEEGSGGRDLHPESASLPETVAPKERDSNNARPVKVPDHLLMPLSTKGGSEEGVLLQFQLTGRMPNGRELLTWSVSKPIEVLNAKFMIHTHWFFKVPATESYLRSQELFAFQQELSASDDVPEKLLSLRDDQIEFCVKRVTADGALEAQAFLEHIHAIGEQSSARLRKRKWSLFHLGAEGKDAEDSPVVLAAASIPVTFKSSDLKGFSVVFIHKHSNLEVSLYDDSESSVLNDARY